MALHPTVRRGGDCGVAVCYRSFLLLPTQAAIDGNDSTAVSSACRARENADIYKQLFECEGQRNNQRYSITPLVVIAHSRPYLLKGRRRRRRPLQWFGAQTTKAAFRLLSSWPWAKGNRKKQLLFCSTYQINAVIIKSLQKSNTSA